MDNEEYIRVGTCYLKLCRVPTATGEFREKYLPWNIETIRQDHSKDFVANIKKYDGYCFFPAHVDYQRMYGNFLNMYEPIPYHPELGEFPHIRAFLAHIFGPQIELGYDYLQLLLTRPTQILPILLLVSGERNTGKTTFLRLLKMIFGKNATFNTNEDFRSQFNLDWANKLLVMVDELLLNKIEDTEKIKNLSTAGDYKVEAKGKDRREIEFFAKFVLCSNNEKNPIIIPQEEIRFWVLKINPISCDDIRLKDKMRAEIPAFLHFLLHRKLSTEQQSRMWFASTLLETPALLKIKKYNTNKVETEIATYCIEVMDRLEKDTLLCCPKDMLDIVKDAGLKADLVQIRNIFKDNWKLRSEKNGDYIFYHIGSEGELFPAKRKGRYFEIPRSLVEKLLL